MIDVSQGQCQKSSAGNGHSEQKKQATTNLNPGLGCAYIGRSKFYWCSRQTKHIVSEFGCGHLFNRQGKPKEYDKKYFPKSTTRYSNTLHLDYRVCTWYVYNLEPRVGDTSTRICIRSGYEYPAVPGWGVFEGLVLVGDCFTFYQYNSPADQCQSNICYLQYYSSCYYMQFREAGPSLRV